MTSLYNIIDKSFFVKDAQMDSSVHLIISSQIKKKSFFFLAFYS